MITRTKIINDLVERYKYKTYLEIGVRTANENFNHINVENKEGWNCFVINEDFGCAIITKNTLNSEFKILQENKENVSWEEFDKKINKLLDLISYDDFIKIIN